MKFSESTMGSIKYFFGENLASIADQAHFHPTVQTYEGRELGGVACPGILL